MEIVINTFGVTLNRDNNAFVITNKDGRQRVPVDGVTSIIVGKGVLITTDAMMLAVENEIEMLIVERSGTPIGRIWSPKYGSISTIRKGQLAFTQSHDALEWIKGVIAKKMENQEALLLMMESDDDEVMRKTRKAISRIEHFRTKIEALDGKDVADVAQELRGNEGVASNIYFECLNLFLPKKLQFGRRTQHPAMDVINAFLNYGYGVMYGKVESALIKAGIDPYVGVLHRDEYNRPVMVYDVIELYRIWVDYVVWSIATQGAITNEFYSVREDGSYWLENLGRRVLIQSMNDYMDEVVTSDKLQRSRATHVNLYAQNLAQRLKKFVAEKDE